MSENHDIHSFEYINDSRYGWWNKDYLELLLRRINIDYAKSIADIGVGAAHWGSLVASYAKSLERLIGVDNEKHWLTIAKKNLAKTIPNASISLIRADAHNLPLSKDSFDLVTCQTLLMHCAQPQIVVNEMVRILRPGGWLLLIEPVNLLNRSQLFDAIAFLDPREQAELFQLWSWYHKSLKESYGFDHDIALALPHILISSGLKSVDMFANDRMVIRTNSDITTDDIKTEYNNEKIIKLLNAQGISSRKIYKVRKLAEALNYKIEEYGEYSAIPLNMFAAVGRKPA